jgi:hypothetical protein
MMVLASQLLALAAMTALCVAMPKHHAQVWQHEGTPRRRALLRAAGWLGLLAAVWVCVRADGIGIGLVMFCAVATAAGSAVAWLLPYRPRSVAAFGGAAAALALPVGVLALQG